MKILIAFAMTVVSIAAFAKWTPIVDTTSLTCKEAYTRVKRNGFQHYTVNGKPKWPRTQTYWTDYNRAVHDKLALPAFVPTLDKKACFIGYKLVDRADHSLATE